MYVQGIGYTPAGLEVHFKLNYMLFQLTTNEWPPRIDSFAVTVAEKAITQGI